MQIVGTILIVLLQVFTVAMWARFILDWVQVLAPAFRPKGIILVLSELAYTVTDPPLRLVRRAVKPIPIGGASLDIAWIIVVIAAGILSSLVARIFL